MHSGLFVIIMLIKTTVCASHRCFSIVDEMLANWQKSGHGKKIEKGILGRVKAILKILSNVFVLDRSLPTSKYCFDCFHKNENLKVWEREFVCPNCGRITGRDIHAAQNMIAFYK